MNRGQQKDTREVGKDEIIQGQWVMIGTWILFYLKQQVTGTLTQELHDPIYAFKGLL